MLIFSWIVNIQTVPDEIIVLLNILYYIDIRYYICIIVWAKAIDLRRIFSLILKLKHRRVVSKQNKKTI